MAIQLISEEVLSLERKSVLDKHKKLLGKNVSFSVEKGIYDLEGVFLFRNPSVVLPENCWLLVLQVHCVNIGVNSDFLALQVLYGERMIWLVMDGYPKTRFSEGLKLLTGDNAINS